jgi:flagellar basal-body rod modification protein FlgD
MSIPAIGTTSSVGPTGSAASTDTASATAASGFDALGKDTFLKLMVAQLRNQDPMNPTDSTQFLAQTAQFTSLEKLEDVAGLTTQALNAQMATGEQVTGPVSSVTFTSTGPVLTVGGADVPMNDVVSVSSASAS